MQKCIAPAAKGWRFSADPIAVRGIPATAAATTVGYGSMALLTPRNSDIPSCAPVSEVTQSTTDQMTTPRRKHDRCPISQSGLRRELINQRRFAIPRMKSVASKDKMTKEIRL